MSSQNTSVIKIDTVSGKSLNKQQQQFNAYTSKIEKLKTEIVETKRQLDEANARIVKELLPIDNQIIQSNLDMLEILDRQHDSNNFKKTQKKIIAEMILDIATHLVLDRDNKNAIKYFDKYNGESFEEIEKQAEIDEKEFLKSYAKKEKINLDGLDSPEDIADHIDQQLKEKFEKQSQKKNSTKSKAQIDREEKKKEKEKNIHQTARSVYLELVKEFHPDLETDEEERKRKTEIMKNITLAYEKKDLFELLKLQLDYLQINSNSMSKLAEEKIKYFNHVLKEQIKNLQSELSELIGEPSDYFFTNFYDRYCGIKSDMDRKFKKEKRELKSVLKHFNQQIDIFRDTEELGKYLKKN